LRPWKMLCLVVVITKLHLRCNLRLPNLEWSSWLLRDSLVAIDVPIHPEWVVRVIWIRLSITDWWIVPSFRLFSFTLEARSARLSVLRQIWLRVIVLAIAA
jgi:hypothetical protein